VGEDEPHLAVAVDAGAGGRIADRTHLALLGGSGKDVGGTLQQLGLPLGGLVRVDIEAFGQRGKRRPGVTQLAMICKAPAVSEEAFYHNWQQGHSALSFALYPLRLSYVRNAVARVLTTGAPEVLEEMYRELPGFADNASTTTGPMSEYAFA
jgi:hypothetical protein